MDYLATSGDHNNTTNAPIKSRVDSCFVPMCPSTSTKFANKLFLTGPSDPKLRKKWFQAAKRMDHYSPKTTIRCCEDHFDLENDVQNWMKFKMCGGKLFLKKDVVPHIFECQNRMLPLKPRSVIMKRKRREILESIEITPVNSYHRFPHPVRNPERFKAWVNVAGGKLDGPDDYELYSKKIICDIHFTAKDRNRNNRLNCLAVPSLHLPEKTGDGSVKCAKCGITPKEDPSLSFHRFPQPSKHEPLKAQVWAIYCYPNDDWSSNESLQKLYAQRKMLCGRHFDDSCLTGNRLNTFAIPTEAHGILAQLRAKQCNASNTQETKDPKPTDHTQLEPIPSPSQHSESIEDSNIQDDCLPESPVPAKEVCRVCLAYNVKMYRVQEYNLCQMLYDVTGLKVGENEGIFQNVCFECAARLSAAAAFRDKALTSYAILRRLLNSIDAITTDDIENIRETHDILKPALTVQEVFYTVDINNDNEHNTIDNIDQESVSDFDTSQNSYGLKKPVPKHTFDTINDKYKDIVKTYCDVETIDNFNITQRERRCLDVSVENIAMNDGNIAISGENIAISGENIAISGETIAISDENIAISGENIAISGENIAISGENIAISDNNIAISDENIAISDENIKKLNDRYNLVVHDKDNIIIDEQSTSRDNSLNVINVNENLTRKVTERLKALNCSNLDKNLKRDLAEEFGVTAKDVQSIFDTSGLSNKRPQKRKGMHIPRIIAEQKKRIISLRKDGV